MKHLPLLLVVILLAGCGSGSRFASSFGKRKYNKGYYFNIPGSKETTAAAKPKAQQSLKGMLVTSNKSVAANTSADIIRNMQAAPIIACTISKPIHNKAIVPVIAHTSGTVTETVANTATSQYYYNDRHSGSSALWVILGVFLFLSVVAGGILLIVLISSVSSVTLKVALIIGGLLVTIILAISVYAIIVDHDPGEANSAGEVAGAIFKFFFDILLSIH